MGSITTTIRSNYKIYRRKINKLEDAVSRMPVGEITSPQGDDAFEVPH
jgi:hypothetical protein